MAETITETLTLQDLTKRYEDNTTRVIARCSFATDLVGGLPATKDGIRAFVKHWIQAHPFAPTPEIPVPETEDQIVERIMKSELGERNVPSEEGELKERMTYGINVLRRDEHGPWIGDWMVKACLKAAASRAGIFTQKRGSKGDVAEMGRVRAYGISLKNPQRSERIYLLAEDSDAPALTYFEKFMGRVNSASGSNSIVHDSEVAPAGTRFEFEFRCGASKIGREEIIDMFSNAMNLGLGSVKAMERGKFKIEKLDLELTKQRTGKDKT